MSSSTISKPVLFAIMAAILTCMCASLLFAHQSAFAADLTSGKLSSMQSNNGALKAQASKAKKTLYVISSLTIKSNLDKSTKTIKYSYNKNGLLTKRATSEKVLDKFSYKKKKLMSEWHDGGQGAPSNIEYTYKNGKPVKSYDTVNRNTKRLAYNKKGLVSKLTNVYSASYSVSTTYKYNKQGKPVSSKYSTWQNPAYKIDYDTKGNPKLITEYWNDSTSQYSLTKHKNTYKNGRLAKTVANNVTSRYTTSYSIKYKKIKASSSYGTTVKKQQKDLASLIYAPSVFLYGLPLGYY